MDGQSALGMFGMLTKTVLLVLGAATGLLAVLGVLTLTYMSVKCIMKAVKTLKAKVSGLRKAKVKATVPQPS